MLTIQFHCEHCQKLLQLPTDSRGKSCRCPSCGQVMTVPLDDSSAAALPRWDSSSPFASPLADSTNPARNPYAPVASPSGMYVTPHRAVLVLMFGIMSVCAGVLSFACCMLTFPFGVGFGIPAVIMGNTDLKSMQQGQMDPAGRDQTKAGLICGIIGIVLSCLSILMTIFGIVMAFV